MGRTGRPVLILGVTAIAVAAVGTSVALTRDDVPIAKAATTVAQTHGALIVTPTGATAPARVGQRVPNGDIVHTPRGASAALLTRGRVVYVGSQTSSATLAIVDGAHQQLRTGTAIVDAQRGPGLTLDLAGDVLTVPDHAATEATRSVTVQVGSLVGSSTLTNSSARTLEIPTLFQATVNGDALSSSTTPLHLMYAAVPAEAQVVPNLVSDDRELTTLANGIDVSGTGTAQTIETAWHGTALAQPKAAAPSEQVLPMVIADATSDGGALQDRYTHVVDWRRAGGSWGVTLALLHGRAAAVEKSFASLKGAPGQVGTKVQVAALAHPVIQHGGPGGGGGNPDPGHSEHPTPPTSPTTNPPGGGNTGGGSTGSDKPHGPVTKVLGTVGTVVGQVLKLLPGTKPVHASPSPQPSKSSGGLLKGLLGGH